MWYLTILYLYVNINTCCCITNGIKKGWLKCWMSGILPAWGVFHRVMPWLEQQPCRNVSVPGAGCSQAGDGAGVRHLLLSAILCCSCAPAVGILTPCVTSQVHQLTRPAAPPATEQCWHQFAVPLFVSLFAGTVPYRNTWREQKLQSGTTTVLVGQFSLLCYLVNLIQCLASAPSSSTRSCLILTPLG